MVDARNVLPLLIERLKTLPIYSIFENCSEKESITAVQFMNIVDYRANNIKLYDRIKESQQPKLLGQLLQFTQFEKFKYFHYVVNKQYGSYVLQCKYCPLVGLCGCILTHMAINHNVHIGLKLCVFCNSQTLESHLASNSLAHCYDEYIKRNAVEIDEQICRIVVDFYEMLRKLSKTLNICSTRSKGYVGQGYRRREVLSHDYGGDISPECEVRYMIPRNKLNRTIRSDSLDREFYRIMEFRYGEMFPSILRKDQSTVNHENVIEIDSDDDDDDEVNNLTAENNASNASQYHDTASAQHQIPHTLPNGMSNYEMPENLIKCESIESNVPMASSSTPMEGRMSRLSTCTSASQQRSNWTPANENEEFAFNMARKLDRIPANKRRQLEIDIEMKILQTEMEAIEEGNLE